MRQSFLQLCFLLFMFVPMIAGCQPTDRTKTLLALEGKAPEGFYEEAAKQYKAGNKKDAAFLFYLGQLRVRYYAAATNADGPTRETYNALQVVLGEPINAYLGTNKEEWIAMIDEVLAWDSLHDYTFYSKQKALAKAKEIRDGLKDLRAKLAYTKETSKDASYFSYLPGFTFRLFDNTPLKKLAAAVEYERVEEMAELVKDKKIDIDLTEPKFGNTLLMCAVVNKRLAAVEQLLKLGANPNKMDATDEQNSMIVACGYSDDCDTAMLKLLIKYGGDVNSKEKINGPDAKAHKGMVRSTLLMTAITSDCPAHVKVLINAGADINACNYEPGYGAITVSLVHGHMDIARYLIIEKKAVVPAYCMEQMDKYGNKTKATVTDLLNQEEYLGGSDNAKIKSELLAYLKAKGLK